MNTPTNPPDYTGNACAALPNEDRDRLWWAACTLVEERGLILRITNVIGQGTEWATGKAADLGKKLLGGTWEEKIREYAEEALWRAHDIATLGLDPKNEKQPWAWFNKAISSFSGAVGGFVGLPGMAIDIPLSTLMIMRSIAEIARSHGEDIASDEGKRACLEVIAFGGPGVDDDDTEIGYWSTRALFSHATIGIAIRQAAARFGIVLSQKTLAQLIPVAGAFAGGSLNYVFMDFYQQMARVHFTIRSIERSYAEDSSVRGCLDQLVRQARQVQRAGSRRAGRSLPSDFVP